MDNLEKIHAKEEIKKWKRSLSEKDWQEYKKKVRLRKETEHKIQRITKRIDKAIKDKNRISVEEEKEKLEQAFLRSYIPERIDVSHCLPSSLRDSYFLVYHQHIYVLYDTFQEKIEKFLNQPPSSPSSPTILHTMDAITRCENSLSPEEKALLDTKKLERRSIRGRITKAINKLKKDIDAGNKFSVSNSKSNLSETLKDLDKKDDEIWAIYDDEAMAADMSLGEQWNEKGSAAITEADEFLDSVTPAVTPLSPAAPTPSAVHHARIPKIDLPKFSGKTPA